MNSNSRSYETLPDRRKHRGPHPQDLKLFDSSQRPTLRSATNDLCWLLSRGYALPSSTKIVGDRYVLTDRQRTAVNRCACSDRQQAERLAKLVANDALRGGLLTIDGFNLITTIEAALAGGVILIARDGAFRDMASMHGSYRNVAETDTAIDLIGKTLAKFGVIDCLWLLDQPVSNSGKLKTMLLDIAARSNWNWQVELVPDPDPILMQNMGVVVTADSNILDHAGHWWNLAREVIEARVPDAWRMDLSIPD